MSTNCAPRRPRRPIVPLATAALVTIAAFAGLSSPALAAGTSPQLSNQASSSGYPVGIPIFDSAMLGYGANPTGTITFRLYAPWDPSCGYGPVFTWNTAVNGNGYYTSGSFVTPWAGAYRWTATYNGDANNNPVATACSASGGMVAVSKRTPTLSGGATLLSGRATTDSVTLNGASPTGNVTFSLYGPNNLTCAGAPIFTSTKSVWGNGTFTSDAFTPSASGTYQWIATYSGDSNNNAAGSVCADPAHALVATGRVVAGFSLTVGPLSVKPAGALTVTWTNIASPTAYDWVALYAVGAPDWAVKAWKYTGGAASGNVTMTVPWGTPLGAYEVRLFANNSYTRLGTAAVTVVAP